MMTILALWLYVFGVAGLSHFSKPETTAGWTAVILWPVVIPIMVVMEGW